MLERQKMVVKYLRDSDEWTRGSEIAQVLKVTDRTIRNDILAINRMYEKDIIISTKGKGYRYNYFNKESKVDSVTDVGTLSTKERWIYIVKRLIVSENGINLFDISDDLFISESTLQNDIIKIKRGFLRIGIDYISIVKNGDLLSLNCDLSERYMLLYEFAKYKFVNLQLNDLQKYFNNIDLRIIYNSIADILKDSNYISRYLMLTKVTIIVALVVECRGHINYSIAINNLEKKNIEIAEKIAEFLYDKLEIELNLKSILNIAYHLNIISNIHFIEDNIRKKDTADFDEYNLYKNKILKISNGINIDLAKDEELFHDMIVHIMVAVKRIKVGVKIYNPLRENLKNKYPLLFGFANKLLNEISLYEGVNFDFNELAYIVAYLSTIVYTELGKLKKIRVINVLLIVSDGRANLNYIYNEIKNGISYDGVNIEKISHLNQMSTNELINKFDLIITTSREDVKFTINDYVEVRKSFDMVEKNRVIAEIDKIRIRLIEEKIESLFDYFFSDKIFHNIDTVNSQEKLINVIYELFNCNGSTNAIEYFQEKCMKISLKSGIGLLYKIDENIQKDKMAIVKLKNPISWCDDKVKIIISILNNSQNINKVNVIVTYLLELGEKPEFNEKLRKCTDLNDLKKLIVESYLKDALG